MATWFLETGVYLLGVVVIPGVGLLLVAWGLWCDRSKGRPRCPNCWADMRTSLPSRTCPKCGYTPESERGLYRDRRGPWRIALGVVLLLVFSCPSLALWSPEWMTVWQLIRRGHSVQTSTGSYGVRYVSAVRLGNSATDADLTECAKFPGLVRLVISKGASVTDRGLAHLRGLEYLADVDLSGTQVTDAGLAHLAQCQYMWELNLSGTQVTDAGLVHLQGMAYLTELDLSGTQVTGVGLVHLRGLEFLGQLDLSDTLLTDAGLAHLAGVPYTGSLNLSGTRVTDAGLVHLKGMENLLELDLSGTQLTGDGLLHLKGLKSLGWLNLSGTQVTDAGLTHLKGMANLRALDLARTPVTEAGVAKLKGASPRPYVTR